MIETVPISSLHLNELNPRVIKDHKFQQIVKSIREFPQMLNIRPIVVDADMVVLGGNMRLRACQEAGLKEVPVIRAADLTDDQRRRFIIADNVGYGEWDWEALANEWDAGELADWGVDVPAFDVPYYSGKNQEVNTDDFEDKCTLTLNYTLEEYEQVKTALHKIADTPEQAVWQLLKL